MGNKTEIRVKYENILSHDVDELVGNTSWAFKKGLFLDDSKITVKKALMLIYNKRPILNHHYPGVVALSEAV